MYHAGCRQKTKFLKSFQKANTMIDSSINIPIACAPIRNLSLGLCRVSISYRVNRMCPPSNPGIGSRFITPSIIDSSADMLQKVYQFHFSGKMLPMLITDPTSL